MRIIEKRTVDDMILGDKDYHQAEMTQLAIDIKQLEGEYNFHRKRVLALDEDAIKENNIKRAKQAFAKRIKKQNLIYDILKKLNKPVTAGPICKELGKLGHELHSSFFAAVYLKDLQADKRIIIKEINASKFEYSLK